MPPFLSTTLRDSTHTDFHHRYDGGNSSSYGGRDGGYGGGARGGRGGGFGGGDRMGELGANLKTQQWDVNTMPKFEKSFYKEDPAVTARSRRTSTSSAPITP
jgi:hypothetical protein